MMATHEDHLEDHLNRGSGHQDASMSSGDDSLPTLPTIPERAPESHKGDYGRALLVGGSRDMPGAIALAGMAALRSGAGLVTLAVASTCQECVASFEPSLMTVGLPADPAGRIALNARERIETLAQEATVLAVGPGLGRSSDLNQLVAWMYRSLTSTMVVDADALNALSDDRQTLETPGGPRILTPHPGEFTRIVGGKTVSVAQRSSLAVQLAARCGVVVVLKGHRTLITDGQLQINATTGNPGMATGGSGDVLTGVIAALVGQGLTPREAAQLGVHAHGLAGDLVAVELGEVGMIASDLIRFLPRVFKQLSGRT